MGVGVKKKTMDSRVNWNTTPLYVGWVGGVVKVLVTIHESMKVCIGGLFRLMYIYFCKRKKNDWGG